MPLTPIDISYRAPENELKQGMAKYHNAVLKIELQNFVSMGMNSGNELIQNVMSKFKERYLNY
jgi:hypothetical protein